MGDKCEEKFIKISTDDLRQIVSDEMNDCLNKLGIDPDDWAEHQKDSIYLRKARTTSEKVGAAIMKTTLGLFVVGFVSMLVLGVKTYFGV